MDGDVVSEPTPPVAGARSHAFVNGVCQSSATPPGSLAPRQGCRAGVATKVAIDVLEVMDVDHSPNSPTLSLCAASYSRVSYSA